MDSLELNLTRYEAALTHTLKAGKNPYSNVDGVTTHLIPSEACTGRTGANGKTFAGYFDAQNGVLHFDCSEQLDFYLTIDLNKVPHFAASPGGPEADKAQASFEAAASVEVSK